MLQTISEKVTKIQAMYRQKVARQHYRKRISARTFIQFNVLKFIKRRKWQKEVELHASSYLTIVIRI